MREMEACFFCTTPYQVCTVVGMIRSLNYHNVDIYILNQFEEAAQLVQSVEKEGIADRVILVDDHLIKEKYFIRKGEIRQRLRILLTYFQISKIVPDILLPHTAYNQMFVSTKAVVPNLVHLYFVKKKLPVEYYYFDDGEGSYDNDLIYRTGKRDYLIRRIVFGKESCRYDYPRYLYSPKLYSLLHTDGALVRKIPNFWNETQYRLLMNRIFHYETDAGINIIDTQVIILDIYRGETKTDLGRFFDAKIKAVEELVGADSFLIKQHPRTIQEKNTNYRYMCDSSLPFELVCMNNDLEEKVIIAYSSTAVVTPKLLFNQEPYIILLYKMYNTSDIPERQERYYHACKELYKSNSRFIIPETEDEFYEAIKLVQTHLINNRYKSM